MMMKARHLFAAHSGNVIPPREKSRSAGNMLQMKHCNENVLSCMAQTPLFANLSEAIRKKLAQDLNVRVRDYSAREYVIHEGDLATEIVCVLSGRLLVYESGLKSDSRHLIHGLRPGAVYGASLPALTLNENPATLISGKDTRLLFCKVDKVRKLIESRSCPAFVTNLYAAAACQGFNAWRKLTLLSCYKISDRILLYLRWRQEDGLADSEMPNIVDLAEYLGVNRTALYRAIADLKRKKRITVVNCKISLPSFDASH